MTYFRRCRPSWMQPPVPLPATHRRDGSPYLDEAPRAQSYLSDPDTCHAVHGVDMYDVMELEPELWDPNIGDR